MTELTHWGVLGQKWGKQNGPPYPLDSEDHSASERKAGWKTSLNGKHNESKWAENKGDPKTQEEAKKLYTNDDGSLTDAGKKKLQQMKEAATQARDADTQAKDVSDRWNNRVYQNGGKKLDDDTDVISKGTTTQRIASGQESVDSKRKYMSFVDSDKERYRQEAEFLPLQSLSDVRIDTYEFKKDIKVRNGEAVTKDILNQYGDQRLKDAYMDRSTLGAFDSKYNLYDKNSNMSEGERFLAKYVDNGHDEIHSKMAKVLNDTTMNSKLFESYKKQGYDAIVDAEDYSDMFNYPIILLNPADTSKRIDSKLLYG